MSRIFFNSFMQFGSWRKRRSARSLQNMGECFLDCSAKTITCLILICVIERSALFEDVDTGSYNQFFPEGLWVCGII